MLINKLFEFLLLSEVAIFHLAPIIMPPDTEIDDKLPPKATQFCKLKVPRGGITIKVSFVLVWSIN